MYFRQFLTNPAFFHMLKNSILLHFLALSAGSSAFLIKANPANAVIINVPFTWRLEQTGSSRAQSVVFNDGPANTNKSDPKTLTGLIRVIADHTPPQNATRLDELPSTTILNINGSFSGELAGTCVAFVSDLTGFDCYSKASASLTSPVTFTPSEQIWRNVGVLPFNIPLNDQLTVGAGNYPITGTVNVDTLFGLGLGALGDSVSGEATLDVNANFFPGVETTFDIRYEVVPEPFTILGSSMALGFGALFKKEYSRKQKKIKSLEKQKA
jgi:hypothetical protein